MRYRIETTDDLVFQDPPQIEDETQVFHMTLAATIVTFEMKEHHPSEEAARVPVEEYLRAWELEIVLQYRCSVVSGYLEGAAKDAWR